MPKALKQNTPHLSIHLDQEDSYRAGGIISGHVARGSHFVDAETILVIRLMGRIRTQIFAPAVNVPGENGSYRGHFDVFGPKGIEAVLYQGPLHIPRSSPNPQKWPFTLAIPLFQQTKSTEDLPRASVSLNASDKSHHVLPPSFTFKGRSADGHIEYSLEAVLEGKRNKVCKAAKAICITSLFSPIPITDFDLQFHSQAISTALTLKQSPSHTYDEYMSWKQRTWRLLHKPKGTSCRFYLHMLLPSVLQVNSDMCIPFQVRVILLDGAGTNEGDGKCEIRQVGMERASLELEAATTLLASSHLLAREDSESIRHELARYRRRKPNGKAIAAPKLPYKSATSDIHCLEGASSGEPLEVPVGPNSCFLDIGRKLGVTMAGIRLPEVLFPSFTSCIIKVTYCLRWDFVFDIAGQFVHVKGKQAVEVMGPTAKDITM